MHGRTDFPLMDDVVSVSFSLSMNASAKGKRWQGIIQLKTPLELDHRTGDPVQLSVLHSPRWYGPKEVQVQLLSNDIAPSGGINSDPRYDIVYTLQVIINVSPEASTFTNKKLVLWGTLGAPESPVTVTNWPDLPVSTDTPFVVKNRTNTFTVESSWFPIAGDINMSPSVAQPIAITLTGNRTLTTNEALAPLIVLRGSLGSVPTITLPVVTFSTRIVNELSIDVNVKFAGETTLTTITAGSAKDFYNL